ncbi:MAG: hypothetical protein P1V18_02805 [Candidatus Gracilibacteria bacterium]|nr:hypothetical protein [Candidatus Gracilibacteria bacterium]
MNTPSHAHTPKKPRSLPSGLPVLLTAVFLAACAGTSTKQPTRPQLPKKQHIKNEQEPQRVRKETAAKVKTTLEKKEKVKSIEMNQALLKKETKAVFKNFDKMTESQKSIAMILYANAYWDDLYNQDDLYSAFDKYRDLEDSLEKKLSDFQGLDLFQEAELTGKHISKLQKIKAPKKDLDEAYLNLERLQTLIVHAVIQMVIDDNKATYSADASPIDVLNESQGDCDSFIYPVWALLKGIGIETYLLETLSENSGHAQLVHQNGMTANLQVFQLSTTVKNNRIQYVSTEHKNFADFIAFHDKNLFKKTRVKNWSLILDGLELYGYGAAVKNANPTKNRPSMTSSFQKKTPYMKIIQACHTNGAVSPLEISKRSD